MRAVFTAAVLAWAAAAFGQPTITNLGALPGGTESFAWGVSGDGSVAVGRSFSTSRERAWLWTPTVGMVDLNAYLSTLGGTSTAGLSNEPRA